MKGIKVYKIWLILGFLVFSTISYGDIIPLSYKYGASEPLTLRLDNHSNTELTIKLDYSNHTKSVGHEGYYLNNMIWTTSIPTLPEDAEYVLQSGQSKEVNVLAVGSTFAPGQHCTAHDPGSKISLSIKKGRTELFYSKNLLHMIVKGKCDKQDMSTYPPIMHWEVNSTEKAYDDDLNNLRFIITNNLRSTYPNITGSYPESVNLFIYSI